MINTTNIHSIETFGTVDGPGIRTIIFMQGCNLKCKYCHNRDTWDINGGTNITIDEAIDRILRSKTYIDASNGGVTISGGEPLLHAPFIIELFKRLKELNIHTCIDTNGCFELTDEIKELLSLTDLVLLDIKHIDDKKAIDLVGVSNKYALEFAKYLSEQKIPVWIRQVLVPGYTDNESDLLKLKEFISSLSNVEKVEILPYHDFGSYKWKELNLKYPLENVCAPSNETISRSKEILGIQ